MHAEWNRLFARAVLIVAAHPDDEVIGAGSLLASLKDPHVLHVTDGAPRNLADAHAAGCATREQYARLRRTELECALAMAGVESERALAMGVTDQEAMLHLEDITLQVAECIQRYRPGWILTHPYEGGHPDHDSCAFAVHTACRLVDVSPAIVEFTSYHDKEGQMVTGEFLTNGEQLLEVRLTDHARRTKQRMFECYASQQHMLVNFPLDAERFRPAPDYDFTKPPHRGTLLYERFGWASGERYRALAAQTLNRLAVQQVL